MFDTIRKQAYSLIGQEDFQPKTWYEGTWSIPSLYSNYSGLYIELEEQCCSHCPSMSFEYRLMCCIFCIVLGFLISMGSTFRLMKLLAGNPYPFAVLYSIGNILGISSTCFLFGPVAQFKKMFAPTRYFFPPPHFAIFDGIVFLGLSHPFVTCFSCFWHCFLLSTLTISPVEYSWLLCLFFVSFLRWYGIL